MTNKKNVKSYAPEFKESIVALYQTGRSASSLAREYQVSVSTVTKWIHQANPTHEQTISLREQALLKENQRLKEENDILKRAAVLLAKN